ncbi:MAG TPA: fibronectin type III domain-containing protein [Gaiellales bacterium]|nr:fibronectin type III domain-containing protein [Gaiellales bacterium]
MTPPAVSGTPVDGQTLAADPGVWNGTTPMVDAYQWRRCDAAETTCSNVAGATASTYVVGPGDVGSKLKVEVTATNVAGQGAADSSATALVAGNPPVSTDVPTITGVAQEGETLTASTGSWGGTPPITFAYQWRRCDNAGANCLDIVSGVYSTYSPTVLDLGSTLRVSVTATNMAGSSTAISAPTAPVAGPADIQPSFPIRAAFYYPWYPQTWTVNGHYPHYTPSLGYYDSSSTAVIQQHVQAMEYGKIQVGISSWWGQGTVTDNRLPLLLSTTQNLGSRLRWAVYYEPEGQGDPTSAQITSDLTYIRDHYGNNPAYLRVNGRFVVFVYAGAADACGMADRWHQANTVNAYVVLKVFSGYRTCANQPDSWHQYAPATAADSQAGYSYSISPGFWKADESSPRLTRDLARWSQNVRDMVASNAPWQLVTTFNEWGEGTAAESANEWSTSSGFGAYLDTLHNDGAGNGDGTPPSPPSNLATSNVTGTGLTLSWTASNDNVGVAGYRVYVGSSNVGTPTGTSQAITGLTCGTSYTLGVEAYDDAGNTSTR